VKSKGKQAAACYGDLKSEAKQLGFEDLHAIGVLSVTLRKKSLCHGVVRLFFATPLLSTQQLAAAARKRKEGRGNVFSES
jgi:hypothetical protein